MPIMKMMPELMAIRLLGHEVMYRFRNFLSKWTHLGALNKRNFREGFGFRAPGGIHLTRIFPYKEGRASHKSLRCYSTRAHFHTRVPLVNVSRLHKRLSGKDAAY